MQSAQVPHMQLVEGMAGCRVQVSDECTVFQLQCLLAAEGYAVQGPLLGVVLTHRAPACPLHPCSFPTIEPPVTVKKDLLFETHWLGMQCELQ